MDRRNNQPNNSTSSNNSDQDSSWTFLDDPREPPVSIMNRSTPIRATVAVEADENSVNSDNSETESESETTDLDDPEHNSDIDNTEDAPTQEICNSCGAIVPEHDTQQSPFIEYDSSIKAVTDIITTTNELATTKPTTSIMEAAAIKPVLERKDKLTLLIIGVMMLGIITIMMCHWRIAEIVLFNDNIARDIDGEHSEIVRHNMEMKEQLRILTEVVDHQGRQIRAMDEAFMKVLEKYDYTDKHFNRPTIDTNLRNYFAATKELDEDIHRKQYENQRRLKLAKYQKSHAPRA